MTLLISVSSENLSHENSLKEDIEKADTKQRFLDITANLSAKLIQIQAERNILLTSIAERFCASVGSMHNIPDLERSYDIVKNRLLEAPFGQLSIAIQSFISTVSYRLKKLDPEIITSWKERLLKVLKALKSIEADIVLLKQLADEVLVHLGNYGVRAMHLAINYMDGEEDKGNIVM